MKNKFRPAIILTGLALAAGSFLVPSGDSGALPRVVNNTIYGMGGTTEAAGDGLVDAVDYTIWRDASTASGCNCMKWDVAPNRDM